MYHRLLRRWSEVPVTVRKPVATVVGLLLILCGAVLVVLPGPFTIPPMVLGLTVLGTEYRWARTAEHAVVDRAKRVVGKLRHRDGAAATAAQERASSTWERS